MPGMPLPKPPASENARKPVRVRAVPAVTRAIAILRLLGGQKSGRGVKAIADELELIPSTCLHILRVLVAENLVTQDRDSKRYTLGSGMVSLARQALESAGFANVARPVLESIAAKWGITALGVELTARETMVVLVAARPDQPLQLHADVGSEFFSLTSATGRLVAAFGGLALEDLRAGFRKVQWDQPLAFDQWSLEVEQARTQGWAVDRDRYRSGITAFAVPVCPPSGTISHSLVAMGLSSEMGNLDPQALIADMQRAAMQIAHDLAG